METIQTLHAELEELKKRYWHCFNNWDCNEDLEKIQCEMEELKYKLSVEEKGISEKPTKEIMPAATYALRVGAR